MTDYKPAFAIRLLSALKVRKFISAEPTRYYLNGFKAEPCPEGGALCVATDGHRLGIQRDSEGVVLSPVICQLPASFKQPSAKEMKANYKGPWLVCMADGGKGYASVVWLKAGENDTPENAILAIEDASLRVGDVVIDGTFPDWKRVVPKPAENAVARSFNPQYIKDFGTNMTLTGDDADSPHLVQTTDRDFVGVMMPMRFIAAPVPAWLA